LTDDSLNIAIGAPMFELAAPTAAAGYLVAATDFLRGAQAFECSHAQHLRSYSLLTGFALENVLKAFLRLNGYDEQRLKSQYGHDLRKLWATCHAEGLGIQSGMPPHVAVLADGHWKPEFEGARNFAVRYPIGFHGQQFPNFTEMLASVESVFFAVNQWMKEDSR
jgi:hypothetical protein